MGARRSQSPMALGINLIIGQSLIDRDLIKVKYAADRITIQNVVGGRVETVRQV